MPELAERRLGAVNKWQPIFIVLGLILLAIFAVANKVQPLDKFGTPVEIVRLFGGAEKYQTAVKELESELSSLVK